MTNRYNTTGSPIMDLAISEVDAAIDRRERAAEEGQPPFILWMLTMEAKTKLRRARNLSQARHNAALN